MDIHDLEKLVRLLRQFGVQYYQSGDTTIVLGTEQPAFTEATPALELGPEKHIRALPELYAHPSLGIVDALPKSK